jgi:hypothetical protein
MRIVAEGGDEVKTILPTIVRIWFVLSVTPGFPVGSSLDDEYRNPCDQQQRDPAAWPKQLEDNPGSD